MIDEMNLGKTFIVAELTESFKSLTLQRPKLLR